MNDYAPPFVLTPKILDLCTQISKLVGRYEGLNLPAPKVELQKEHRIKSIHGTVAIEGNTLAIQQITALLDGKPVLGPAKDIKEAQNAIEAYALLNTFDIYSVKDFRRAHQVLMDAR